MLLNENRSDTCTSPQIEDSGYSLALPGTGRTKWRIWFSVHWKATFGLTWFPEFSGLLKLWSFFYFLGLVCDFHKGTDVSALSCLKISWHIPWVFAKLSISVIESEKRSDAPEPGKTGSSASQREPLEFSQWQVPGAECRAASVIFLASPWCLRGHSQAWAAWVCMPRSCRMGGLSQAAGSENKLCG